MIPNNEAIRKILVVTLSNLGDIVLTLPVFQALIHRYPDAEIHAVTSAGGAQVFEGDKRIAKVIVYDKKAPFARQKDFLMSLRYERYDVIVDLRKSLLGLLGGARHRNSYFYSPKKKTHRALKHLGALESLLGPSAPLEDIFLKGTAAPIGEPGQRIIVAAVGSKSDLKKWPAEAYAALLDRLAIQDQCRIVLVGDINDLPDSLKVRSVMRSDALNRTGETDFRELCGIIRQASLVITNDSAPLHIADAMKIPTLSLFGPTDPRKYGPRLNKSVVVRRSLFCSPCEKAQCRYGHHACIKEISVDEVYKKATQILDEVYQPKNFRILIIRLDRIGDVVLSLPAVQAIRRRFPNAHIAMMVRPYTQSIAAGNPWVDEVIPYHYEKKGRHSSILGNLRFLKEIMARRFDVAFIFHPGHRSHLVPFFTGIPYRIGLRRGFDSFLLTKSIPDRCHEGLKHESEYILDIVRAFGIDTSIEKPLEWPVHAEDALFVRERLSSHGWNPDTPFVALHPGASCLSKKWPKERFAELAARVLRETPFNIVLVGGAEEKAAAAVIEMACADKARVLNLVGALRLTQLAAVLKNARAVVSNDSGPAHIAAAVGTRTVCIFGRNQAGLGARRWRPLGEGHVVIQKNVGCAVCLAHRCTIDFECLKAVSVESVFESLHKILNAQTADSAVSAG